jgi:tRNA(Arg) A34 adenosine deaminase TadA
LLRDGALIGAGGAALSLMGAGTQALASPGSPQLRDIPSTKALRAAMRRAIDVADDTKKPFGAVLIDEENGAFVAEAVNTTKESHDPSAHAEVAVMRKAGIAGVDLSKTVLVTTVESCPMCAACACYARIKGVVYGTSLEFLIKHGRGSILISQAMVIAAAPEDLRMPLVGGVLSDQTDALVLKKS